ncbi:DUF1328 family protein [Thiomicrospira sp. WB1]|jgi:Skp family chaperone for outer membrane proteins|uniref:DUF1328 family protein n=1 Tax=Thiomicrospira sp. WB1 TaxID=1685380 RepID=UPI0007464999|nr:DUF1328 family protein [Thiomicrospira sp. WB1]KUJ71595.1 hypothetical protein AVO41_08765 [Thiomicrospira sp. WB1]
MKKKTLVVAIVAAMFGFQSIAQAASISTRVRILESKVQKHAQLMERHQKQNQQYQQQMQRGLSEMRALKQEIQAKLEKSEDPRQRLQRGNAPLRYTYP